VIFLAGRVFQRQGFRGFVQFDVGGELGHDLMSVSVELSRSLVGAGLPAMAISRSPPPASRLLHRSHMTYRI
jgi:hypothetical protein